MDQASVLVVKGVKIKKATVPGRKRPRDHDDETRLAIAIAPGTYEEIARRYDVKAKTVSRMRALYRSGLLTVAGQVVEPDPDVLAIFVRVPQPKRVVAKGADRKKPSHTGRGHLSDEMRRAIASEEGHSKEVAARHGVSDTSVISWRRKLSEGKL